MSLPVSATAQNLILNGGFETATVGVPTGTPFPFYPTTLDSWSAVNTDGEFILGPSQAYTGNGFMSMLENGGQNPGTGWLGGGGPSLGYDRGVQEVDVASSTWYILRYWYRAGDGSRYGYGAGNALIQVEEVLPTFASIATAQHPATSSWQEDSILFVTGAATSRIMVLFSALGAGTTDTWYDDLDLHIHHQGPTGIGEQEADTQWLFDEGAGVLWVETSSSTSGQQLEIYNATGARVAAPTVDHADRWAVDLSGLANSTYLVVLRTRDGSRTHKLALLR